MSAVGRSRMTVSNCPDVGPLPDAPGRRGVGSVCVPMGVSWPAALNGAVTGCPLFQLVSVLQLPLLSPHQTAGMSWSLRNSIPPLSTLKSRLLLPLLKLVSRPVLAYCQKVHGCGSP